MNKIKVSKNVYDELKALYVGIYCLRWRWLTEDERRKICCAIEGNFMMLDRLQVPYPVQNRAIHAAEIKEKFENIFEAVV